MTGNKKGGFWTPNSKRPPKRRDETESCYLDRHKCAGFVRVGHGQKMPCSCKCHKTKKAQEAHGSNEESNYETYTLV